MKILKFKAILLLVTGMLVTQSCTQKELNQKELQVQKEWNNLQEQYKEYSKVISQIIMTTKGYVENNSEALKELIHKRYLAEKVAVNAEVLTAEQIKSFEEAQNAMSQSLEKLLKQAESIEELQKNARFIALEEKIINLQKEIPELQKAYNKAVMIYQLQREKFPLNLFANLFGYEDKGLFQE